jgi:hypothetical protein
VLSVFLCAFSCAAHYQPQDSKSHEGRDALRPTDPASSFATETIQATRKCRSDIQILAHTALFVLSTRLLLETAAG